MSSMNRTDQDECYDPGKVSPVDRAMPREDDFGGFMYWADEGAHPTDRATHERSRPTASPPPVGIACASPDMTDALDDIQGLIIDVENGFGDPHTLRHAKASLGLLRSLRTANPSADGYIAAFYDIAAMLDIGARSASPVDVWANEMRPKLEALIASDNATRAYTEAVLVMSPKAQRIDAFQHGPTGNWGDCPHCGRDGSEGHAVNCLMSISAVPGGDAPKTQPGD